MPRPAPARLYAGQRLRALRVRLGLRQAAMAAQVGISVSYLCQIEGGDRPLTRAVLVALARAFPRDWGELAGAGDGDREEAALLAAVEAGGDASVPGGVLDADTVTRAMRTRPDLAHRMAALHAAYRQVQDQLRVLDDRVGAGAPDAAPLPWEDVRQWFGDAGNYVDPLDRFAEALARRLGTDGDPFARLCARLRAAHGVAVEVADGIAGPAGLSRFDRALRLIRVDGALPLESRAFLVAHQLARLEAAELMEEVVAGAALHSGAARDLLRVGLANYAAGALLMPYEPFRQAAHAERHDVDRLRRGFGVSFEQACHRLSTLQRPGRQGVPVFFCRIDMAGNITKRHSATRLQFAQFGGTCPLWSVHEAVAIPDRIVVQLAEMPDRTRYVSIARGLVKPAADYRTPARRYAVALGCEAEHAGAFVYADGLDLHRPEAATPIGSSCRICPREHCAQRAFPPAGRGIVVEPDARDVVPYRIA